MNNQKITADFIEKALPDIVAYGLKALFVGYNPGIQSAKVGHHYAGNSNRFWKLLYEADITPYRFKPEEDVKLLDLKLGSTNIVDRPSRSSADISSKEFKKGAEKLADLIRDIRPVNVCYVGFGVYRAFASHVLGVSQSRINVVKGMSPNSLIDGVKDFICSNPSGLNTIPYSDQLECFKQLKSLL
jgi:TDG/mug DNA glycosylase family protein